MGGAAGKQTKLKSYIRKMLRQPIRQTIAAIDWKLTRRRLARMAGERAQQGTTYTCVGEVQLLSLLPLGAIQLPLEERHKWLELADLYCRHYVDLLGSGWTYVGYQQNPRGVEGHCYSVEIKPFAERINAQNLAMASSLREHLSADYRAIDWQRDFKSGYRWREDLPSGEVRYGALPGVDVKVPWELARMQHLPILAYAYGYTHDDKYLQEFMDEVVDFMSNNPPGFGVNWFCSMDVGIRIANILMAYDLLVSFGAGFPAWFTEILACSALSHGRHIIVNLESSPIFMGNHFLSDVVGLLAVAVHLESTEETLGYLAFSLQELVRANRYQFAADGANFEASTSYHRLSLELMLYSTAMGMGLSAKKRDSLKAYHGTLKDIYPKLAKQENQEYDTAQINLFPEWYFERLGKMVEFSRALMYDGRHIEQIGDNDSGRLFKLAPVMERLTVAAAREKYLNLEKYEVLPDTDSFWDEDILDHQHLLVVAEALWGVCDGSVDGQILRALCDGKTVPQGVRNDLVSTEMACQSFTESLDEWERRLGEMFETDAQVSYSFASNEDLTHGLGVSAYPNFGLWIFRGDNIYLTARAGSVGQLGLGGHAHNDALAITLRIAGKMLVTDPGTYLYTPLLERRNAFRSVQAHFAPQCGGREPNLWQGAFGVLDDRAQARCLYAGADGIVMCHDGFGERVYRIVKISHDRVVVTDYGRNLSRWQPFEYFSPGYGKLTRVTR